MPKNTPASPPKNFEAALAELDNLVQAMESANLPLEDVLARYQRGVELLRYCRDTLEGAERRIQVIEDGLARPLDTPTTEDAQ